MAEMYGAPIGIGAAEQDMRQDALAGLQATQALGQIEMQPAHKRLLNAQADLEEAKVRDAQIMQELAANYQASQLAAEKGRTLTVADTPKIRKAPGQELIDMATLGMSKGISPVLLTPLWEKGALIAQHNAAAESSQATTEKAKLEAQHAQAEQRGSMAQAMLEAGPEKYSQILAYVMQNVGPEQRKALGTIPTTYKEAVPRLQAIVTNSMKVKDRLTLEAQKIKDTAQMARWNAENVATTAGVGVATAREELIKARTENLRKNGGDGTPLAVEAKKELIAARKARMEAQDKKDYPPAPIDPAARRFEQTYTAANGAKFVWSKDPTTGKGVARLLKAPPTSVSSVEDTSDEGDE